MPLLYYYNYLLFFRLIILLFLHLCKEMFVEIVVGSVELQGMKKINASK